MEPKKISEMIRMKKKKMMDAAPELVDTDSKPDMNPMDMYNVQQQGRIESTLDTPHKIDSRDAEMNENEVGLSPDEMKRMGRLRKYYDKLDLDM